MSAKLARTAPGKLLCEEFFMHEPEHVARAMLGKLLVRREAAGWLAGRIVETEAYLGFDDPASHAFRGETARNAVMFGPPGRAYVYFIYGMHYCVNAKCQDVGAPGAVLLRALEPLAGLERMAELRGLAPGGPLKMLTSGPARLCEALGITRARDDGKNFISPRSDLQLRDDKFSAGKIEASRRIGITKAADLKLRFSIEGNSCVSR